MGRSVTYHVVGQTAVVDGCFCEVGAMSRLEIVQHRERGMKDGRPIRWWFAQTLVGERILGGVGPVKDAEVPRVSVVGCPICDGRGCCVCNYSGLTRRGHWRGWLEWQLAMIRKDATGETAEAAAAKVQGMGLVRKGR